MEFPNNQNINIKAIKNPPLLTEGFYKSWHRAIFPGSLPPSIVAAVRLYLRVRDGNGCVPVAMAPSLLGQIRCDEDIVSDLIFSLEVKLHALKTAY